MTPAPRRLPASTPPSRPSQRDRVFIGGGAAVYAGAWRWPRLADRLELTLVEGDFAGDMFFPPYRHLSGGGGPFRRTFPERHPAEGTARPPSGSTRSSGGPLGPPDRANQRVCTTRRVSVPRRRRDAHGVDARREVRAL